MFTAFMPASRAAPPSNVLTWDYLPADVVTYGVTVFNIERKSELCVGTAPFVEIAAPTNGFRTFTDTAINSGVTYCYRIAATGPGGKSPY